MSDEADRPDRHTNGSAEDQRPRGAHTRRSAQPSRIQRFSQVYGWRAYAVPVLVLATFLALVGVVRTVNAEGVDTQKAALTVPAVVSHTSAVSTTSPPSSSSAAASTTKPADAEGEQLDPSAAPVTNYVETGNAQLGIVPGQSKVLGTAGPIKRFAVEIEGGLKVEGPAFAKAVAAILGDKRSWGAGGQMRFQRVSGGQIDFRVALVSPAHVESLCPGYGTGGYTSCRFQDRAVINLARWSVGVPFYEGHLSEYRQMVINHEVGHWLGHGHEQCPGAGKLAPVMQQQTLSMQGCAINPWPYPNSPADNPANPNAA